MRKCMINRHNYTMNEYIDNIFQNRIDQGMRMVYNHIIRMQCTYFCMKEVM